MSGKIIEERTKQEVDEQEEATDDERERRKHRHKRSRSHRHIPEYVQKKLREVRDLYQSIPKVPKPMEKATPTSYADSSFSDDIALIEIPKRFTVPNMKSYDGTTHKNMWHNINKECLLCQYLKSTENLVCARALVQH